MKNLDELTESYEGKEIAKDFGEQCAGMKIFDAVKIARLLAASFEVGKKVGSNEAKAAMIDVLKKQLS